MSTSDHLSIYTKCISEQNYGLECLSSEGCAGSLVCNSSKKCACAAKTPYHQKDNICAASEYIQIYFMLNVCNSAIETRDKT